MLNTPKICREAQFYMACTIGCRLENACESSFTTTSQIDEKVYRGSGDTASETFLVDFTVGRNLVFRLDTDDRAHVTSPPHLIRPTGGIIGGAEFDPTSFVWTINVPMAEVSGGRGEEGPSLLRS